MDEEYDSIFKEFEGIECLYYEMLAKAEVSYEVSIKKLRRINELFENDEPKRTKALRAFFSVDFFTEWERKWEMLYRKVENADRFLIMEAAPYLLSGRLTDFFEYEYLWKEYSRFKTDEEFRQSVAPPQSTDNADIKREEPAAPRNCPPIETDDTLDTPTEGQLDPRLDNFKFGYLCTLLEQHGITQGGKYNYIERDKAHNWAIAGYLIREVTKRFGIKIQGGGAAWSILCPFWKIRESSARNGSQYDKGGSEEKRKEINDIITEALEKNISD